MPARLSRLRIAGFKSFAEPVSLEILPGLTGIVGPNGCGKSNVVEALRWAMGETSARSLRGGEMDDVIFAGTTARASRNLAEVTITLEPGNLGSGMIEQGTLETVGDGALPAPHEAEIELQVTRRIERGAGSSYRVNGREARARDVQTLYADLASGARSSGMVSQGRVSQLVNAKPEERRQVLEEAAGITGLHARRHEAELKLRAAEQNLARAADVSTQLDGAREAMRKQARQAGRYKTISGLIRAAEGEHLAVKLAAAQAALEAAEQAGALARAAVEAAGAAVREGSAAWAAAEAALPGPRGEVSAAERALERRRMEAEGLAEAAARVTAEAEAAQARLLELQADLEAAERARGDAGASVRRLEAEVARLAGLTAALPERIAAAEAAGAAAWTAMEAASRAEEGAQDAAQAANLALMEARAAEQSGLQVRDAALAQAIAARAEAVVAEAALVADEALAAAQDGLARLAEAVSSAERAAEHAELVRAAAAQAQARAGAEAEFLAQALREAGQTEAEAAARAARLAQACAGQREALQGLIGRRGTEDALAGLRAAAADAASAAVGADVSWELAEAEAGLAAQSAALLARQAEDLTGQRDRAAASAAAAHGYLARLERDVAAARAALAQAEGAAPAPDLVAGARDRARSAEAVAEAARAALAERQAEAAAAEAVLAQARASANQARADLARADSEAAGLAELVGQGAASAGVLGAMEAPEGLELALGAALGSGGEASLNPADLEFWRELPVGEEPPDLPGLCARMGDLVAAPAALGRALAHVGLLPDGADGDDWHAGLGCGVVLVRRDGACWRWDGRVARAGAPNEAAVRLIQRRRLAEARQAASVAGEAAARAGTVLAAADLAHGAAAASFQAARLAVPLTEAEARQAGVARDRVEAASAQAEARLGSLRPASARLGEDLQAAGVALEAALAGEAGLAGAAQASEVAREAADRARAAALALEAARQRRGAARAAVQSAQDRARVEEARAGEIEARIAASAPALAEAEAQLEAAVARLEEARARLAELGDGDAAQASLTKAAAAERAAREAETGSRAARQAAGSALEAARANLAQLRARAAQAEATYTALAGLAARRGAELAEADAVARACRNRLEAMSDTADLNAAAVRARAAHEAARLEAQASRGRLDGLRGEVAQAEAGAAVAAGELVAWQARHAEAAGRADGLAGRCQAARTAWQEMAAAPDELTAKAGRSEGALAAAEAAHEVAKAELSACEARARALAMALRDGEQRQAACREAFVRTEAASEGEAGAVRGVLARAVERLGEDAALPAAADFSAAAEERARRRLERLSRERDEMGPVNLRADLELAELDERAGHLEREREELGTAIAKLRGSIGHLNREGRERLTAVFTQVDQHFRTLFTRMMGGGRAHLALVGSEDPLSAGLEIYAEPPGKKLSSLALLSGGEQALTALSLIFAVFRCNPAPVSVLDEVDAPLDDANVERFCTLLDDVVRETGTRFLVVTHHQLTMSRMDRLFGVTMQERGVSRLLSVDLRGAVAMVEPVMAAAE